MTEQTKVPYSIRLPAEVVERIVAESLARDVTQTDFLSEALREKFDRITSKEDKGWGPLAGLDDHDRARVVKFIDCLRVAPRDRGFRRAVDANFAWLMETVARSTSHAKK